MPPFDFLHLKYNTVSAKIKQDNAKNYFAQDKKLYINYIFRGLLLEKSCNNYEKVLY